ncbi:MAG: cation-translocating P-type ATPase [Candidatus Promineifilaceae bacterium]
MDWHLLESERVLKDLDVRPKQGLSSAEVEQRRAKYGPNEIQEGESRSKLSILTDQFRDVMVLILVAAAVVSFVIAFLEGHGDYLDGIVILAIVIINAALGYVQENRAEQAMAALKELASPNTKVRRDGKTREVPAKELVPGDIVLLDAGDAISADARIIESMNLRVQEASLTGESEPVRKHTKALNSENTPLGDRKNMVYMGTAVTYGRGVVVVAETGMQTELGNIAQLIQNVENDQTPLQKRMAQLGRTLALVVLGIIGLVMVLGLLRGDDPIELFLTAVAMAVAAIPEGLPAIVTISLALGAQKMLERKALIRKLPAVETLGSVTTICSDKTGTLTQNRMTVQVLDLADEKLVLEGRKEGGDPEFRLVEGNEDLATIELLLVASALCNDAEIEADDQHPMGYRTIGDPTEAALLVAAEVYGLTKPRLTELFPRVGELPFSSDRKRMTTVHRVTEDAIAKIDPQARKTFSKFAGDYGAFSKGALNHMMALSKYVWLHDHLEPMDDMWRQRIQAHHDEMASQGLRVLGVAIRVYDELPDESQLEQDMTFVGIIGMMDPPRPEVRDAVAETVTAGIRPVMITGDHPITAKQIAKQLNIAKDGDRVVTGQELELMSMEELESIVETVPVFARVAPEHKLNIVQALQNKGHVVAMTGDGVNDAPALRRSDIGVAMGITGTDVSKEASEMVILDDNFATIVAAVKEGRTIYDNVRKFLQYILTSNAGEIYVMLIGPLLGMPLPLIPLQILWINLVTDGLPGLALSVEPSEPDTMTRAPFAPDESIFSRGIGARIMWAGLLMGLVSLSVGYAGFMGWIAPPEGTDTTLWWRTLVFNTLTLSQMGNALAIRSNRESVFTLGFRSNMLLVYAILLTFVLQLAVIYVPFLQAIFDTTALSFGDLLLTLVLSSIVFLAIELEKLIKRQRTA